MMDKGFIAPIIIIVLIVVSLGAGAYYFFRVHFTNEFALPQGPASVDTTEADAAREAAIRQNLKDQYKKMKDAFGSLSTIADWGDDRMKEDYDRINEALFNWADASGAFSLGELIAQAQADAESVKDYIERLKKLVDDLSKNKRLSQADIDRYRQIIADAEEEVDEASDEIDDIADDYGGGGGDSVTGGGSTGGGSTGGTGGNTGGGSTGGTGDGSTGGDDDDDGGDDDSATSTDELPIDEEDSGGGGGSGSPGWQYPDRHRTLTPGEPDLIEGDNPN